MPVVCGLVAAMGCHRHRSAQAPGRSIAQRFDACWAYVNDARWDRLTTCFAPDAVSEQPGSGTAPAIGPGAIVARARALETALPDTKGEPLIELVQDDHLVGIVLVRGPKTGALVSQVLEVGKDGRIQRVATYGDLTALPRAPARAASLPHHERVAIATDDERERVDASVVPQLIELFDRHDLADLDTVLDDELVWSDALAAADGDRAGLRAALAQLWKAIPDLRVQETDLYRARGYVAIAGTAEGTLRGAHVVVPYAAMTELEGGKIIKGWVFFQRTALDGAHPR